jgi:4'-phosphopantetheinyl transferase
MHTDTQINFEWQQAPSDISLPDDEVHVWRARLDRTDSSVKKYLGALSQDEQERAARFRFDKDRTHFIVARGLLRQTLAQYLKTTADRIAFRYNRFGKPCLTGICEQSLMQFNVSHSQGLALFAFSSGRDIGVDVEYIRPDVLEENIAEHFFSVCEVEALRKVPKNLRSEAFFNCWTRKEAYIKAVGEGLSFPLNEFDVSLAPGAPAVLLSNRLSPQAGLRWALRDLNVGPDFKAALAVEGHNWLLKCWQASE